MSDSDEGKPKPSFDVSSGEVIKSGWLSKQGGGHKSVKKRWVIFTRSAIQYFKTEKLGDPLGVIYVRRITGVRKTEDAKGSNAFELDTPERVYIFYAPTPDEQKQWVDAIQSILPAKVKTEGLQLLKTGYLTKQGKGVKSWKRRWFVLRKDKLLSYYADEHETFILGTIDMASCTEVKLSNYTTFNKAFCFEIITPDRIYPIFAQSKEEMDSWVDSLSEIVKTNITEEKQKEDEDDLLSQEEISKNLDLNSKISKEGFLIKQGGMIKNWKRRWFVLRESTLSYYKEKTDQYPVGLIKLSDCKSFSLVSDKLNRPFSFEIVTNDRTYYCSALDQEEMWAWINALSESLNKGSQLKDDKEFAALRRVSQIATKQSELKVQVIRKATAKKFRQLVSRYNAKKQNQNEKPRKINENERASWSTEVKNQDDNRKKEINQLESEKENLINQMDASKMSILNQQKLSDQNDSDSDNGYKKPIGYALATMDYSPNAYDEDAIGFVKGDILVIEEKEGSGNWRGRIITNKDGVTEYSKPGSFPCRYVEEVDRPDFLDEKEDSIEISVTLEDQDWTDNLDDAATNLFQLYDGDGDGFITKTDFFEFLYEFGKTHLSDKQVDLCWEVLDRNKSGKVDSTSFTLGIKRLDEVDFFSDQK